jgi:hypothetical protein
LQEAVADALAPCFAGNLPVVMLLCLWVEANLRPKVFLTFTLAPTADALVAVALNRGPASLIACNARRCGHGQGPHTAK